MKKNRNNSSVNRIANIDGIQYRLNRIIDKTEKDLHHIMGKKYKHQYNTEIPQNKKVISRREHVDYNNFVKDKQSPREAFQKVYELTKEILSEGVRKELYTIFYEADDDLFYIPELLRGKKHGKNG